jgi:hypothetical protein
MSLESAGSGLSGDIRYLYIRKNFNCKKLSMQKFSDFEFFTDMKISICEKTCQSNAQISCFHMISSTCICSKNLTPKTLRFTSNSHFLVIFKGDWLPFAFFSLCFYMRFFGFVVPVFKAGFLIEREEYWESCDGF